MCKNLKVLPYLNLAGGIDMNLNKLQNENNNIELHISFNESYIKEWAKPKHLSWKEFVQRMNDTEDYILYNTLLLFDAEVFTLVGSIVNDEDLEQSIKVELIKNKKMHRYFYEIHREHSTEIIENLRNTIESELTSVESISLIEIDRNMETS